jgi:hypothetical protein
MPSTNDSQSLVSRDGEALIEAFRHAVRSGRPWFPTLMETIADWDVPQELVDGREYRYLVGGEAFDWLVLAERICNAVETDGLLPLHDVDALLLDEHMPQPLSEAAFKRALGPAKYRAHLNFVYGVLVEEALQLAMEQRSHKERGTLMMAHDARVDGDIFHRIYGATRRELLREFRTAQERPMTDRLSLTEHKEFTYWLFKRRVGRQDPARVASDTRQGMLMLHRLQELKRLRDRRPPGNMAPVPGTADASPIEEFIDAVAIPLR